MVFLLCFQVIIFVTIVPLFTRKNTFFQIEIRSTHKASGKWSYSLTLRHRPGRRKREGGGRDHTRRRHHHHPCHHNRAEGHALHGTCHRPLLQTLRLICL